MFKCRQCGKKFGANPPSICPACGVAHDRSARGVWLVLLLDNLILLAVIAFLVVGAILAARYVL